MLTKVTLKEFMRILPQLEFAIKRLVNLKNHNYSSMLFGTWKKTSLNQLDAVDYCTTDAIWWLLSKSFFNYVFFLSLFFYAQILFHIILSKPIFIVSCWYAMWWFPPIVSSIVVDPFLTPKMLWFGDFSWPFFIWILICENFSHEKSTEAKKKGLFIEGEKNPQKRAVAMQ